MKEIYNTLSQLQDVLARMFEIEDKIKEIPKALADKEAVLQKTKISSRTFASGSMRPV